MGGYASMKKALIGGFLSLLSSLWLIAFYFCILNNMVTSYFTPPGRFISTINTLGLAIPILIAIVFLILGIIIMIIEFFNKD